MLQGHVAGVGGELYRICVNTSSDHVSAEVAVHSLLLTLSPAPAAWCGTGAGSR